MKIIYLVCIVLNGLLLVLKFGLIGIQIAVHLIDSLNECLILLQNLAIALDFFLILFNIAIFYLKLFVKFVYFGLGHF